MSEMADVFLLETSESFEKQEGVGMYMDITKAKFQELIDAVKARNKESENKLVWGLVDDDFDDFDEEDFEEEDEGAEEAAEEAEAEAEAEPAEEEAKEEPADEA